MKLRRWISAGTVALAAAAALNTLPASAGNPSRPAEQTLRALGARHHLQIGTAVDIGTGGVMPDHVHLFVRADPATSPS